jgi:hypothetical protein
MVPEYQFLRDLLLECPLVYAPFDFASLDCARDRQGRRGVNECPLAHARGSDWRSGFHFAANFPRMTEMNFRGGASFEVKVSV